MAALRVGDVVKTRTYYAMKIRPSCRVCGALLSTVENPTCSLCGTQYERFADGHHRVVAVASP